MENMKKEETVVETLREHESLSFSFSFFFFLIEKITPSKSEDRDRVKGNCT